MNGLETISNEDWEVLRDVWFKRIAEEPTLRYEKEPWQMARPTPQKIGDRFVITHGFCHILYGTKDQGILDRQFEIVKVADAITTCELTMGAELKEGEQVVSHFSECSFQRFVYRELQ